jgi:hypothetical protein
LRVIPVGPIATAVKEGLAFLLDPEKTGAVVVTLPETLPVSEALELVSGIEQHRIPLRHAFLNRVPRDPFTDGERHAVRELLSSMPPTLGARTVDRIERAHASAARFKDGVNVSVTELPDAWTDGPTLVSEIAQALAGASSS